MGKNQWQGMEGMPHKNQARQGGGEEEGGENAVVPRGVGLKTVATDRKKGYRNDSCFPCILAAAKI
jgi:hypothetical protein